MSLLDAHAINLSWLIKLRWGALLGQLVTVAVVAGPLGIELPLGPLGLVMALEAVSNLGAWAWLRGRRDVREPVLVALLALDVVFLTALLWLTGGPSNPFNFLYLVYIALGAVVLRSGFTWALVSLCVLSSGALFLSEGGHAGHGSAMRLHLEGMWVAFAVAAGFIVYFVTRVRRALAEREGELEAERRLAATNEKLAALATLAAGAAHELASPLATIAVVARELERRPGAIDRDDVALIRAEVDRCRKILDRMAADAGERTGEGFSETSVSALLGAATAEVAGPVRIAVAHDGPARLPVETLAQAVRGLVRNAHDASRAEVVLRGDLVDGQLTIEVEDQGPGMSAEVLARVGEPFFTTKPAGQGMGLGLFLTRTIAERLGGRFEVQSAPGAGTRVRLRLPATPVAGTP